jgi:hypothetical protein
MEADPWHRFKSGTLRNNPYVPSGAGTGVIAPLHCHKGSSTSIRRMPHRLDASVRPREGRIVIACH